MNPGDLVPLQDVSPAAWLVAPLSGARGLVRDLVPASYAAHVRVPESDDWLGDAPSLFALRDVLARHTESPDRCWFTFWVGFPLPRRWQRAPRLQLPHREHLVFEAGLDDLETISEAFGEVGYGEPTLWWPEDRAWVAHWEVDSDAVYVAGSEDLLVDLVGSGLGAHAVGPDDPITIQG